MRKKLLSAILSTMMVASLFAGCGQSGSSSSSTSADGVVEITWMFWDDLNATEDSTYEIL